MTLGRWGEVGVLSLARMSMGAQLQVVGALGPLLIGTLVADWAALGTLIGTYSLAGVLRRAAAGCCWRGSGTVSCCLAVSA